MSSPEIERFEMSADDVAAAFDPTSRRRFRQSKNQATYGIWADDSDEERPSFAPKKKSDVTSHINFVSGGIKQGDKIKKEKKRGDEEDEDMEEEEEEQVYSRKGSSGFSGFKGSRKQRNTMSHIFTGHRPDKEFGSWEKHTKGIGMGLLMKMGYKPGEGLGKAGQGITTPVEAVKRKGKASIGYYGSERTERSLKDFPVVDEDEKEDEEFKAQLQQWKTKPEVGKKQRPKYVYKTAQEVIESGGKKKRVRSADIPKVKVIDMTGREKRVLSGYHAIGHHHDKPDEAELLVQEPRHTMAFSMPELMHNLNLLVDQAEEEIIANDRKLRCSKDALVNMCHEKERLQSLTAEEEKHINRLQLVLEIVDRCESRCQPGSPNPLTLDDCVAIFKSLNQEFHEEYKLYDLEALAVALVFPLMKKFYTSWDPMTAPEYGLLTMKEWQLLLAQDSPPYGQDQSNMDLYQRLIWDIWLPHVRSAALRWNTRKYEPFISLLNQWSSLVPPWIMANILDQLVLPRLLSEVEDWNPLTDTVPVHQWLHPWLPLMGEKLEPLYAPIRYKLANALTGWHPSDGSARIILLPWVGVFKQGHMEAFLIKNILPKLAQAMAEFIINPLQQNIDPWRWVMAWKGIIPTPAMVSMLEKTFFPRWLQVLCSWLVNGPNYQEVTKWYMGWKAQFPEEFLAHPSVKDYFSRALDIMNHAVSGPMQPGPKDDMGYMGADRRLMDAPPPPPPPMSQPPPPPPPPEPFYSSSPSLSTPHSFKDLIERQAMNHEILFMPIHGKTHEAKQVYRFGSVQMYLDRNVIFMFDNGMWVPCSLQSLLDRAK